MKGGWESGLEKLLKQVIGENHHAESWKCNVQRVGGIKGDVGGSLRYGFRLGVA